MDATRLGRYGGPLGVLGLVLALAAAPAAGGQPPGAEGAMAAWRGAAAWVREWRVPTAPARIDPQGASGASVTLRLAGRVIGRGTRLGQDGLTVWGATREALLEADAALPFERDALREAHVRDAAASVTLDLELAGPLTPVLGESDEAIASSFSPGHHGVAGRVGATLEAVFPGLLLSTGAGGGEGARIVAGRLGLPPRPLRDLTRDGGLTLYRFETRRLAQERGGAEPVFLYRGGRVVGVGEVTIDRLRRAADEAAEHLMARRWKGEEPHGLLGDYNPVLDRYDPVIAPALAQASAALALARYASVPGAPASRADRATEFAAGLLAGLTRVSTAEEDPLADPLSAAMWLVAREALRAASPDRAAGLPQEFGDRARARVGACFAGGAWTPEAPATGRGLLVLALGVDRAGVDGTEGGAARAAAGRLFKETDRTVLIAEMPWLAWAAQALAPDGAAIPAAGVLREARELVRSFVVSEREGGEDFADMVGGVSFNRVPGGGVARSPLPTWHSLKAVALLGAMLGDPRLTLPDERARETAWLVTTLRFALQLTPGPPEGASYRDPARAAGGFRRSTWDQVQPVDATALGLLALCEVLRAFGGQGER